MRSTVVEEVQAGYADTSPLVTTATIMASLCNVALLALVLFLLLGLFDVTVVTMLWWKRKEPAPGEFPANNATKLAFSWIFNARMLVGVLVALGMTAVMCFVVLARLQVRRVRPSPSDIGDAVAAIMTFNLVAVVTYISLQFVFQAQWEGGGPPP